MDFPDLPPTAPADPTPTQGVSNVPQKVRFKWTPCQDPEGQDVIYDILMGTTPDKMAKVLMTSHAEATFLLPNRGPTIYFWRVFASDPAGNTTAGPLWSFKTAGAPEADVPSGVQGGDSSSGD